MHVIDQIEHGGTYRFCDLDALVGVEFADRIRRLAGVPVPARRKPAAPRGRRAPAQAAPARSAKGFGRVGDRLSRS